MRVFVPIVAAALLAGVVPGHSAPSDVPRDAKSAIDAVNADWIPALEAGDAARTSAGFARDAVFVGVDGVTTRGRAAFESAMEKRFTAGFHVVGGSVVQSGSRYVDGQVIEWGHAFVISTDIKGKRHKGGGLYLSVWRKNEVGQWTIVRNISL